MRMPRLPREYTGSGAREVKTNWHRANGELDLFDDLRDDERLMNTSIDASDFVMDIREYDVPYHVRVMIDHGKASPAWANYLG